MSERVAVFQCANRDYSNEWLESADYPELENLRSMGRLLGFVDGNFFRGSVRPGDRVVVKPNWVMDRRTDGSSMFSAITHSAVLRGVTDLIYEALEGDGQIAIADAPQWDCDFENLMRVTQARHISHYYLEHHGFNIPILDLRQVRCISSSGFIRSGDRLALPGDPAGYAAVDLGSASAFVDMPGHERLYGADYDRRETVRHQSPERHEYLVSKTVLGADVLVHVPKFKVHKKVGVTLNAKGMVGINGNKNWLAHYRVGPPALGGDEYPDQEPAAVKAKARATRFMIDRFLTSGSPLAEAAFVLTRSAYRRLIKPLFKSLRADDSTIRNGDWHGNDTAWRMAADLARVAVFADRSGQMQSTAQRRFVSVVDGIVAGEGDGPLAPTAKPSGILMAGLNLLAVDLVGTRLMGFDWRKVKYLQWLVEASPVMGISFPAQDVEICSNIAAWQDLMQHAELQDLGFEPHPAWKGHIEL